MGLAPYGEPKYAQLMKDHLIDIKEDGSFHDDPTGVEHHGFCRDQLVGKMMNSGLTLVSMETVHQFEKTSSNGPRRYPVFFATGRKRVS